jgi:hypothetical protein
MKYLVDANVLSEPTKPLCVQKVADWMDEHESELVVSPVVTDFTRCGVPVTNPYE